MSKTIHIHIHGRTRDADGPAHAPAGSPKGGQFVSGGGSSGGASHGRPQHSPMRQANRNLEAQQLKESRKVAKAPQLTNIKSVRREQAESDVAEAKKRIAARKSTAGTAPSTRPAGEYSAPGHISPAAKAALAKLAAKPAATVGNGTGGVRNAHEADVHQRTQQAAKGKSAMQEFLAKKKAELAGGSSAAPKSKAVDPKPISFEHGGSEHYHTGKSGTHIGTGEKTHEYEGTDKQGRRNGSRVWRTESGRVYTD